MGLGSVIEKRRQQWCCEFESVKADMGLLRDGAVSAVRAEGVIAWQVLCQSAETAANQDQTVSVLAAAAS